jgi:ribosomal protein S18 acetylase RimI-like enzyme
VKTDHQGVEVFFLDDPLLTPEQRSAAVEHAAAGRGWLRDHIGGPDRRRELFRPALSGRHVIVALFGGQYAGFMSYRHRGRGPMAPRLGDFIRVFGSGAFRPWIAFVIGEARLRARGIYSCGLEVLPEFQRRGVGAALVAEIIRFAGEDLGVDTVELDVRVGNHKARTLFHAFGAKPLNYPFFSLDRLILSTNRDFDRLAFILGPGPKNKRRDGQ